MENNSLKIEEQDPVKENKNPGYIEGMSSMYQKWENLMDNTSSKISYEEIVKEKLIPEYIEGVDLSHIEWLNLDAKQLYEFLTKNYTYEEDGERQIVGNFDESKFNDRDNSPLGFKYLSYKDPEGYDNLPDVPQHDSNNYLIGVVNNNAGKKTMVAALTYERQAKSVYYEQTLPVTKISITEVNSYFEQPEIYKQMMEAFIDVADKENNIVMILLAECLNEDEIQKDCNVFAMLQEAAIDKEFPMSVFLTDMENDTALREMLCAPEDVSQKH